MGNRANQSRIVDTYRKRAAEYDSSDIGGLEPWRKQAVQALGVRRGDLIVDIGCGTGLTFGLLHKAAGSEGRIVGVDLTDAMLAKASRRIADYG